MKRLICRRKIQQGLGCCIAVGTLLTYSVSALSADDLSNERPPSKAIAKGKESFASACAACHGAEGKGMSGVFPPLAKSDFLKPPYKQALEAVIGGMSGALTVNGKEYNNLMTAMSNLSDH